MARCKGADPARRHDPLRVAAHWRALPVGTAVSQVGAACIMKGAGQSSEPNNCTLQGCVPLLPYQMTTPTGPLMTHELISALGLSEQDRWIVLRSNNQTFIIDAFGQTPKDFRTFLPFVHSLLRPRSPRVIYTPHGVTRRSNLRRSSGENGLVTPGLLSESANGRVEGINVFISTSIPSTPGVLAEGQAP
jgi:hypothetical protein